MNKQIQDLIQKYAEIYQRFEDFQKTDLLPSGDQKTGVIGEYYAHCYYQSKPGVKSVEYAKSGEAFDLLLKLESGAEKRIQVKCVSAHSKSRRIAEEDASDRRVFFVNSLLQDIEKT